MTPRSARGLSGPLCALILLGLITGSAHADVYKWVDAQGRTHYSDLPPEDGSKARLVGGLPSAPGRASNAKDAPASTDAGKTGPDAASDTAAKGNASGTNPDNRKTNGKGIQPGTVLNAEDAATTRQRAENCTRLRTELGVLQGDNRVFTLDAKGMRQYIDDDSRAARIAELQRQLPAECD